MQVMLCALAFQFTKPSFATAFLIWVACGCGVAHLVVRVVRALWGVRRVRLRLAATRFVSQCTCDAAVTPFCRHIIAGRRGGGPKTKINWLGRSAAREISGQFS